MFLAKLNLSHPPNKTVHSLNQGCMSSSNSPSFNSDPSEQKCTGRKSLRQAKHTCCSWNSWTFSGGKAKLLRSQSISCLEIEASNKHLHLINSFRQFLEFRLIVGMAALEKRAWTKLLKCRYIYIIWSFIDRLYEWLDTNGDVNVNIIGL